MTNQHYLNTLPQLVEINSPTILIDTDVVENETINTTNDMFFVQNHV